MKNGVYDTVIWLNLCHCLIVISVKITVIASYSSILMHHSFLLIKSVYAQRLILNNNKTQSALNQLSFDLQCLYLAMLSLILF